MWQQCTETHVDSREGEFKSRNSQLRSHLIFDLPVYCKYHYLVIFSIWYLSWMWQTLASMFFEGILARSEPPPPLMIGCNLVILRRARVWLNWSNFLIAFLRFLFTRTPQKVNTISKNSSFPSSLAQSYEHKKPCSVSWRKKETPRRNKCSRRLWSGELHINNMLKNLMLQSYLTMLYFISLCPPRLLCLSLNSNVSPDSKSKYFFFLIFYTCDLLFHLRLVCKV